MKAKKAKKATARFGQALAPAEKQVYGLQLHVTGMAPRSARAVANAKKICEEHLQGQYSLSVIDVYQQPQLAKDAQILAVPTLVKELPLPLRRIIGDLSDREQVLLGLKLTPKPWAE